VQQVQGTDVAVLTDVTVETPQLVTPGEQCKVTFSTEAAISEPDTQLLVLTYAFSFPGQAAPSFLCAGLPGPILTRVAGGFDETHTFMSVYSNSFSPHGTLTLTPCISSSFGGQFRLRRALRSSRVPNQVAIRLGGEARNRLGIPSHEFKYRTVAEEKPSRTRTA
jgi:hypothetical protein